MIEFPLSALWLEQNQTNCQYINIYIQIAYIFETNNRKVSSAIKINSAYLYQLFTPKCLFHFLRGRMTFSSCTNGTSNARDSGSAHA